MERSEVDLEAQRRTSTISFTKQEASSQQLNAPVATPIIQPEIFNALETRFGHHGLLRLREDFDSGHEFAFWKGVVPEDIIAKCCDEADRLKVRYAHKQRCCLKKANLGSPGKISFFTLLTYSFFLNTLSL